MKRNTESVRSSLILLATAMAVSSAHAATLFQEDFSGSTVASASPSAPTSNTTDYAVLSSKNATGSSIDGDSVNLTMGATSSGFAEMQARFTTAAHTLGAGETIMLTMTFRPTNLLADGQTQTINVGLYNSGGSSPVAGGALANGGLGSGTSHPSGAAAGWAGYVGRIGGTGSNGTALYTRDPQLTETTNEAQDLVFSNAGTGAYDDPSGTILANGSLFNLVQSDLYTLTLGVSYDGTNVTVAQNVYEGAGTGGTNVSSESGADTGGYLTYDAFAIGFRGTDGAQGTLEITGLDVAVVPEPSALLLVGMAGFGCMSRRRR